MSLTPALYKSISFRPQFRVLLFLISNPSPVPVTPFGHCGKTARNFNSDSVSIAAMSGHVKCLYPNTYFSRSDGDDGKPKNIPRTKIPDGCVSWSVSAAIINSAFCYNPNSFTADFVLTASWADPPLDAIGFNPKWNQIDGKINRKSHEGEYKVSDKNEPLNIRGRTGMKERGVLGKWGPNHAADPIVTRWKRDAKGKVLNNTKTGKPILQFVSIQRKDTNEWAIPGGMVDPGEQVSVTVRREFMEEALDSTTASEEKKKEMEAMVGAFFSKGDEIYSGYVDDPRNTDNAWMETVAFLFHDEEGTEIGKFDLKAGDDAQALKWTDISADMKLYASHAEFVQKATQKKNAHW